MRKTGKQEKPWKPVQTKPPAKQKKQAQPEKGKQKKELWL